MTRGALFLLPSPKRMMIYDLMGTVINISRDGISDIGIGARLSCGKVLLHEIGDKRSACARAGSVRMHGQKMPPRLVSRRARSLPPRGVSQGKKNTEKKGSVCSLLASGVFIVTQNFASRVEK